MAAGLKHEAEKEWITLIYLITSPHKLVSLSQQLQVAPPAGVCEWDQQHRGFISAGGGCEASAGGQAPLLQRQSFLFSGQILQHAGVMELHLLQSEPEWGWDGRNVYGWKFQSGFFLFLTFDLQELVNKMWIKY